MGSGAGLAGVFWGLFGVGFGVVCRSPVYHLYTPGMPCSAAVVLRTDELRAFVAGFEIVTCQLRNEVKARTVFSVE